MSGQHNPESSPASCMCQSDVLASKRFPDSQNNVYEEEKKCLKMSVFIYNTDGMFRVITFSLKPLPVVLVWLWLILRVASLPPGGLRLHGSAWPYFSK